MVLITLFAAPLLSVLSALGLFRPFLGSDLGLVTTLATSLVAEVLLGAGRQREPQRPL